MQIALLNASHFLAAGNSPLSALTCMGGGATGVVATGTTITDALQLSASWNTITTSSASTGVILPPTEAGALMGIRNDSGQTISLFPKSGDKLNDANADAAVTIADNTLSRYECPAAGLWFGGATTFET